MQPEGAGAAARSVLTDLSVGLRRATDAAAVLTATVIALRDPLDVRRGAIWHGEPTRMVLEAAEPPDPDFAADFEPLAAEVARTGELQTTGAMVAVPLVALGQPIGVLALASGTPGSFGGDTTPLIEAVALQAAAAIESVRRFKEVMELERLKRDFINRVSHELRTPITIIGGFLSTLLAHDDAVEPEQRRHMLERSLAASDRLANLIEDLLVLSRLEAGVLSPALATFDVASVLSAVRAESALPDAVTIDVEPGLVVTSDRELLARAVGFVIDNAIKYAGAAEVAAAGTTGAPRVVIDVRDHGAGIPADVRATLFEMFTRGSDVSEIPGLGVGLPVARTLLEVLGAEIEVVDPPSGRGALVRITVPR